MTIINAETGSDKIFEAVVRESRDRYGSSIDSHE